MPPDSLAFDPEVFERKVCAERPSPLNDGERLQLGMVLRHPVVERAIANVFWQLSDVTVPFMSANLQTLSGISGMVKLQGMLTGCTTFIQLLAAQAVIRTAAEENRE